MTLNGRNSSAISYFEIQLLGGAILFVISGAPRTARLDCCVGKARRWTLARLYQALSADGDLCRG